MSWNLNPQRGLAIAERMLTLLYYKGWTQASMARDSNKRSCSEMSDDAQCFCTLGLAYRATEDLGFPSYDREHFLDPFRTALAPEFEGMVSQWNDAPGRTKDDVIVAITNIKHKLKEMVTNGNTAAPQVG